MNVELEQRPDRLLAHWGEVVLYEYVFAPELPRFLCPRPYFHPVRTLAGQVVTDHQPEDHPWHLGLSYAWPVVNDWTFWGGPSYVHGQDYVDLDNQGVIRHLAWQDGAEELEWLDRNDRRIVHERRQIGRPVVDEAAGSWHLDLSCEIENVSGMPAIIMNAGNATSGSDQFTSATNRIIM